MLTDIFLKAKPILEKIEAQQHEAYFVGGCVRDLFLNRPIKDVDITTSATPDIIQQIFPSVIPVGIEHGTVIVRYEKESYEVTTFRTEGSYSDGRHPDHVEFIRNVEKDLERRDFTINALAMDKNGHIIDLFGGKEDLKNQTIRTVGSGLERFQEDALRIIRALRFSSQLGFQIEKGTFQAMIASKSAILDISVERITSEMERFFAGSAVNNGISYLKETQIGEVLPIFKDFPFLLQGIPQKMKPLASFAEVIAFFHYKEPAIPITSWVNEWKCSNRTKKLAISLYEDLKHFETNGLDIMGIYQLSPERFHSFIRLADLLFDKELTIPELEKLKEKLVIQDRGELTINGNDLIRLFPERNPGPWVKQMLDAAEKAVLLGELTNDYENIKEWLLWNRQEID